MRPDRRSSRTTATRTPATRRAALESERGRSSRRGRLPGLAGRVAAGACTLLVASLCSGWVLGTEHDAGPWGDWVSVGGVVSALRDADSPAASRGTTRDPLPVAGNDADRGGSTRSAGLPGSAPTDDPAADAAAQPVPSPTETGAPVAEPEAPVPTPEPAAPAPAAPAQPAAPPAQPAAPAARPAAPPPPADKATTYAADLVAGVNAERSKAGLSALTPHACAQAAAQEWAQHLAATNTFEHQDIGAVMSRCKLRGVGENIAMTGGSPAEMVTMWMNSPGHKQNILRPGYTGIGSAAVLNSRGQWVGVHVFTS